MPESPENQVEIPQDTADSSEPSIFDQPDGTDWLLAEIIQLAEDTGIELGVTFVIGGSFLSGTLINGRTYFNELGQMMRRATPRIGPQTEESSGLARSLGDLLQHFEQVYPAPSPGEFSPPREFSYVHLRDAKIFTPGGATPAQGFLWRGKLASVAGFSIGQLSVA